MKRYVAIPSPVTLLDPDTDQPAMQVGPDGPQPIPPVTFPEFVRRCLLADPRFVEGYDGICARTDILCSVNLASGYATLDEDDWEKLVATVKSPEHMGPGGQRMRGYARWRAEVMPQFKPFLDAIVNASTTRPE